MNMMLEGGLIQTRNLDLGSDDSQNRKGGNISRVDILQPKSTRSVGCWNTAQSDKEKITGKRDDDGWMDLESDSTVVI